MFPWHLVLSVVVVSLVVFLSLFSGFLLKQHSPLCSCVVL